MTELNTAFHNFEVKHVISLSRLIPIDHDFQQKIKTFTKAFHEENQTSFQCKFDRITWISFS